MGPAPDRRHQGRTVELSTADRHPPIVGTPSRPHGGGDKPLATAALAWADEADTRALAARLASRPAIGRAYVELHGELGAGKTTFVRHLLRALGVQGRIKSPTYAVVEPHEGPGFPISHFDFYRFDDPREWEEAGFRDVFQAPGLKLAEWAEKAAPLLPRADLSIRIDVQPDESRQVTLEAFTALGAELIA